MMLLMTDDNVDNDDTDVDGNVAGDVAELPLVPGQRSVQVVEVDQLVLMMLLILVVVSGSTWPTGTRKP